MTQQFSITSNEIKNIIWLKLNLLFRCNKFEDTEVIEAQVGKHSDNEVDLIHQPYGEAPY